MFFSADLLKGTYEIAKTEIRLKQLMLELISDNPCMKKLIIKLDDGSWGNALGNAVISGDKFLETSNISESIESSVQPWDTLIKEISWVHPTFYLVSKY